MTHAPSKKMKSLLAIAGKAQQDGRSVTSDDIDRARAAVLDDRAIHDTVLIAAAFSMFNRYVDGLDVSAPDDDAFYRRSANTWPTTATTSSSPTKRDSDSNE